MAHADLILFILPWNEQQQQGNSMNLALGDIFRGGLKNIIIEKNGQNMLFENEIFRGDWDYSAHTRHMW